MSSALEEFRAQREAVEGIHARLAETVALLRAIKGEADAMAHNDRLRTLLQDEQTWLVRAENLVSQVRHFRECETSRFWPAVWRRWALAVALATITAFAGGAGYTWAVRPYAREIADLRVRVELLDFVAQRIIKMTPAERRQFDALMKWSEPVKR